MTGQTLSGRWCRPAVQPSYQLTQARGQMCTRPHLLRASAPTLVSVTRVQGQCWSGIRVTTGRGDKSVKPSISGNSSCVTFLVTLNKSPVKVSSSCILGKRVCCLLIQAICSSLLYFLLPAFSSLPRTGQKYNPLLTTTTSPPPTDIQSAADFG